MNVRPRALAVAFLALAVFACACGPAIPEIAVHIEPAVGVIDPRAVDQWVTRRGALGGRYFGLRGAMKEPDDRARYGTLFDLGYYGGGAWGRAAESPAGYYVYVYPYWLVWAGRN